MRMTSVIQPGEYGSEGTCNVFTLFGTIVMHQMGGSASTAL